MLKKLTVLLLLLFSPMMAVNANSAQNTQSEVDDAFMAATFERYPLQTAIQTLIQKNVPVQVIIEEAQKAGHRDGRVTQALYQSNLSEAQVILGAMQSHMSPRRVLKSLADAGVAPEKILNLLIKNESDMNRIFAACRFMLNNGYTKAELVKALSDAGAGRPILIKATRRFDIPPATTVQAYEAVHGEPEKFGHVYTRHSLPKPARIAVGVARIHNTDAFKGRDIISPKNP